MRRLLTVVLSIGAASPAAAWGDRGHRAIADIAWTRMSPAAKRDMRRLLAFAPELATPACPVGSFEDGAIWADCVRSRYRDRFAETGTWHYVDVPVCRSFALPNDGGAGFVVERYRKELAVLADRQNPPVIRLEALLWVEHLLGDLHQPLHVGDASDRGGNEVTVAGREGRYPLNLHAEWDRNLVEDVVRNVPGGVAGLAAGADDGALGRNWHVENPESWARESWEISKTTAYPRGLPGIGCNDAGAVVALDAGYHRLAETVVVLQLEKAGVRLADALNAAAASR